MDGPDAPPAPSDPLPAPAAPGTMQPGRHVVVLMPSGNAKVVKLQPGATVSLGKFGSFRVDDVLGGPMGVPYEIYDKDRARVAPKEAIFDDWDIEEEPEANNREIKDDGQSQTLSQSEIAALKNQGQRGEKHSKEIIQTLMAANANMAKKTSFSRAKLYKRKESKYSRLFTPAAPTSRALSEYYFAHKPANVRYLRIDSLSQMLALGGVGPGWRGIVVDDASGLLLGAVLERMGGEGEVVAVHEGDVPSYVALNYMDGVKNGVKLHFLPWRRLAGPKGAPGKAEGADGDTAPQAGAEGDPHPAGAGSPAEPNAPAPSAADAGSDMAPEDSGEASSDGTPMETDGAAESVGEDLDDADGLEDDSAGANDGGSSSDSGAEADDAGVEKRQKVSESDGAGPDSTTPGPSGDPVYTARQIKKKRLKEESFRHRLAKREAKNAALSAAVECLQAGEFHGLLTASPYHPTPLLAAFLPYLAGSGSFAVFSPYKEPLPETYLWLRSSEMPYINVQLTETMLREWQPKNKRMHPEMMTSGTGGFILSGIKVIRNPDPPKVFLQRLGYSPSGERRGGKRSRK